jgi:ferrous iron transport protein B
MTNGEGTRSGSGPGGGLAASAMVLVIGNPQTGKTTLFHQLCGDRVEVVTIPGTSASVSRGRLDALHPRHWRRSHPLGRDDAPSALDTPGTATLFPQTEEETVVRDALLHARPTALLVVADAKNVRRSLALTIHAAELGLPMVLAVNMSDEASRQGIGVDLERLASELGIDVVATTAVEDVGTDEVRRLLGRARTPRSQLSLPASATRSLETVEGMLGSKAAELPFSPRGMALQLLSGDPEVSALVTRIVGEEGMQPIRDAVAAWRGSLRVPAVVVLTDLLYDAADRLADQVVHRQPRRPGWLDTLGQLAEHPVWGTAIAVLVLTATYYFVGKLGATIVVDSLDQYVFQAALIPATEALVSHVPWQLVREAIMDPDFGLVPTGVFLAFGIVMPVLFFFFLAFGVLQSSGYLPRLSVLLDRLFRRIGLNGKGVMPLVMGLSCVTMALITTRMLESRKERIIASFLLLLGFPCAPLLGVMLVVLAPMPASAAVTVFGVIVVQALIAGVLANRIIPGPSPDFIMVIPPMRLPRLGVVMRQTLGQTYRFMKEAVPLFLLASLVLFTFDRIGGLALVEQVARPVTHGLLGLPDQAVQVFIKTMIRRENGAAELALVRGHFSNVQLVVTLVVMTLLLPCVNSFMVLIKEQGLWIALAIVTTILAYALVVGTLLSQTFAWLGVTFT